MNKPKDMGNVKATNGNFIIGKGFKLSGDDGKLYADNATFDARRYDWQPQTDITAYELAKCMPIVNYMQLIGNSPANTENMVDELPENCQRHFEILE